MSAPAGWHLQPDGRERFWDGTQWTDQFRSTPTADLGDPTAPPPAPSWASTGEGYVSTGPVDPTAPAADPTATAPAADQTQMLDVTRTQAIPAYPPQPAADQASTPYPPAEYYAYPQGAGTPAPGQGAPGYGAPGHVPPGQGWQWQQPPQRRSGWATGCLVAAVVGALLLVAAVVGGIFFVNRAVDQVNETLPSLFPTELPSDLPSDLPSGIPTEGLGERIELSVGDGFDLPRATIGSGWSLESQGAGVPVVNITGMRATLEGDDGFPVLFSMSFPSGEGGTVDTVCTAPSGSAGATVDVSCVPLFGDVAGARRVTVTASL